MVQAAAGKSWDTSRRDDRGPRPFTAGRELVVRSPFRKLRLGLAALCLLFAAPLAWLIMSRQEGPDLELLLSLAVISAGGFALGFLERVVIFSTLRPEATVAWRLFGRFLFLAKQHGLEGADRIKVGLMKLAIVPDPATVFVADEVYPVWCMKGPEALLTVIGDPPEKPRKSRFFFYTTALIDAAMFEDQARHVGALVACALNLPLEVETLGKTYDPADIPPEWFDETRVRARLKWRRM
jgi:hypothetical protein